MLGGWLPAPSTLGTFLRAFTFGHVRQLDRVLAEALARAWKAGAGPGDGRLVVDVESFVGEVWGHAKQGAEFGLHPKARLPPDRGLARETGEVLHIRLRKGSANTSRPPGSSRRGSMPAARSASPISPVRRSASPST